jgi:DNA-binding beta-propeller fold protein YncE
MLRRSFSAVLLAAATATASLAPAPAPAGADTYELWVVDQANPQQGGDRLYIFTPGSWDAPREAHYLWELAEGVGDGPGTRPHLLTFNAEHTHGLLANVASGHVYVIRASDRTVVASIDVGEQAHGAVASADGAQILVANQNGKRLARIRSDFAAEAFDHEADADLDLAALENPAQPDNAPICPTMYVGGTSKAYVTLRGGGLYVVDTAATPMQVTRRYTKDEVAPAGCGGIVHAGKVYVNSGSPTDGHIYVFDAATDDLLKTIPTGSFGTDAHGMVVVGDRYLWMSNRGDGDNILILDTTTDEIVGKIDDVGAAPDILDVSPSGDLVFATLRGPKNLTGGPSAVGETPGVAVLRVDAAGAAGGRVGFIPVGMQGPASPADPHAVAVLRLGR